MADKTLAHRREELLAELYVREYGTCLANIVC